MEAKRTISSVEFQEENISVTMSNDFRNMDISQIKRLVQLINRSDIGEIELNCVNEGLRLALRKLKAPVCSTYIDDVQYRDASEPAMPPNDNEHDQQTRTPNLYQLKAQLVGIFHSSIKPHSQVLPAVGDFVKVGQVIGTIEALSIFNEVEVTIAGRVVEVSIQDGQSVEYGQLLISIDSADGAIV